MRGIEISRAFYEEYGKPMIEAEFGEFRDRIAVGFVGHGSECYGFDDDVSRDHDFEPSFCIWLTDSDEREFGFKLYRAYQKLPKDLYGVKLHNSSLCGGGTKGVMTISEFYRQYTGCEGSPESLLDWLHTPSYFLAEATNGEVFYDPLGEFSRIRNEIKNGMPEDVRLKKIASCAFYMAQTGQYNFERCLSHGESGAARIALHDFVKNAVEIVFLLNKAHMPYYKWAFRAMRDLNVMGDRSSLLERIIDTPNSEKGEIKKGIDIFCADVIEELLRQNVTSSKSKFLEDHAYSINGTIKDSRIRNMSVML